MLPGVLSFGDLQPLLSLVLDKRWGVIARLYVAKLTNT